MYSFENECPNWQPGREPEALALRLADFFKLLENSYGGKHIIWEQWDHGAWDSAAVSLCRELGYSRGAAFLTAYGYGVSVGGSLISALSASPEAERQPEKSIPGPQAATAPEAPIKTPEEPALEASDKPLANSVSEDVAKLPETPAHESKGPGSVPASPPSSPPAPGREINAGEDPGLFHTGSVTLILPYNNSGFIRRDGGGDYYFNVRDFTHHVELSPGLRVRFRLEQRMDHKHRKMRLNAVELSVIASDVSNPDGNNQQI